MLPLDICIVPSKCWTNNGEEFWAHTAPRSDHILGSRFWWSSGPFEISLSTVHERHCHRRWHLRCFDRCLHCVWYAKGGTLSNHRKRIRESVRVHLCRKFSFEDKVHSSWFREREHAFHHPRSKNPCWLLVSRPDPHITWVGIELHVSHAIALVLS